MLWLNSISRICSTVSPSRISGSDVNRQTRISKTIRIAAVASTIRSLFISSPSEFRPASAYSSHRRAVSCPLAIAPPKPHVRAAGRGLSGRDRLLCGVLPLHRLRSGRAWLRRHLDLLGVAGNDRRKRHYEPDKFWGREKPLSALVVF